jgi:SAM-dependent methyltransferase
MTSLLDRFKFRAFRSLPAPVVQAMRRTMHRGVTSQKIFQTEVANRYGLEIGGPSSVFEDRGELPIYRYVAGLDNCVFSLDTIWEGKRTEGQTFSYDRRKKNGFNFIREATDLRDIADHSYDFVLSSHSLEHTSNPIRALREWMRVVKPQGAIIIVLPEYRWTFDWKRQPTPVEHMIEDYQRGTDETDLSHLPEILQYHDLSQDPGGESRDTFRERSLLNFEKRCLHHHVFDECNSRGLLEAVGLTVEVQELVKPYHIVLLARFSPC